MAPPRTNPEIVRFGPFELDLMARQLRKSGVKVKLHDQPFQILAVLVERPGVLVTREELKKKLWPADTFVDFDLSLNSAVKKLRQALNDDSEDPRYVETLYRRGYRFIGSVERTSANGNGSMSTGNPGASYGPEAVAPQSARSQPVSGEAAPPASVSSRTILDRTISGKHWSAVWLYAVIVVLVIFLLDAVYRIKPPLTPRVLGFTQITHDGLFKLNIFSDGDRLYFMEIEGDHFVVKQVSASGGETGSVPTPFANVIIDGVSPDGSALLVTPFKGTESGAGTWSVPLPTGPPRMLGNFRAESVAWSSDGKQVVYSHEREIYVANSDLSNVRKLAVAPDFVSGLRASPDGRKIRFQVSDAGNTYKSLWEMALDGSGLRPLLAGWNTTPQECCGDWTPDGRYFLFQSLRGGRNDIWALPDKSSLLSRILARTPKPVQITNGPLEFGSPVVSRDGKKIFAVGMQPRSELVRYDGKSGFEPYLDGRSIRDLAFSADGRWIAYVTVPDSQLWRSRIDGTERLQLTPEGMYGGLPRWSPDGKQIAFMGTSYKAPWKVYLIGSEGAGLRELIPGAESGYDPSWSADGKAIVLTSDIGGGSKANPAGVVIYDLETKKASPLPEGTQFFSPRWSPDGRYIAAITNDSLKLMLFDRTTQQWQELANMPIGYPSWSHDGQYLYFDTTLSEDAAFLRIRISDRHLERLFSLKGLRRYWGPFASWTGLAPDDSPLLARDISNQEIYAIDWEAP